MVRAEPGDVVPVQHHVGVRVLKVHNRMDVCTVFLNAPYVAELVYSHEIHFLRRQNIDCARIKGNQTLKLYPIRELRLRRWPIIEEVRQAIHNSDGTSFRIIFLVPSHSEYATPKVEGSANFGGQPWVCHGDPHANVHGPMLQ